MSKEDAQKLAAIDNSQKVWIGGLSPGAGLAQRAGCWCVSFIMGYEYGTWDMVVLCIRIRRMQTREVRDGLKRYSFGELQRRHLPQGRLESRGR